MYCAEKLPTQLLPDEMGLMTNKSPAMKFSSFHLFHQHPGWS